MTYIMAVASDHYDNKQEKKTRPGFGVIVK